METPSGQQARLIRYLRDMGLTEPQAIIYLTLQRSDGLRIKELVDLTTIPRSSIYEYVRGLLNLGLIEEVIMNTYKIFRAAPVGILRHELAEQIQEITYQEELLGRLEGRLEEWRSHTAPPTTKVRYYSGMAGARQLFWNTLKADRTVYVYSQWGRGRYMGTDFYKRFVAESKVRGIKERVITNPKPETLDSIKKHLGSPLSRTGLKDIRFVDTKQIAVKGETLIYDNIYAQIYLKDGFIDGFEISSQRFADTQREIFETLWQTAKPIYGL